MLGKNYQISVVTPFHNVDPGVFRYAYESLQGQTLGFQNIEWIVILHNTDEVYAKAVHAMLDACDNVILRELKNDMHTPSSPRNYGMKFATAPYLGFLDADDGFLPECLEVALDHLIRTQSDIVVFRREYEMEQEGLLPATEIVLWDQTREEIVMDRGNWEDEKMFAGFMWGMVTSRLFRRDFIIENGFTFDEKITFTEDVMFLLELYGKAQRICYLPQLIGYHYFINSNSLVQTLAQKSGEMLVSYAASFSKIFDTAFRNGIYIDEFMAIVLRNFAGVMIQTEKLSLAQRRQIKEILEPYVHQIRMLSPSKIISAEETKVIYSLPREVILHPEGFEQGSTVRQLHDGQSILLDILGKNQDTDYGRRFYFSNLRTKEGYQARVPISSYDTYAPLIKLQTQIGESGIFTASPIPCYLLNSGSAGEPRLLPATQEHLKPYCEAFSRFVLGKMTFLMGESLPKERQYNDRAALNSIFGWAITDFSYQQRLGLAMHNVRFTAPTELLFPTEAMDTMYLRLLFALRERDVEQILSPFTWGVLEAFSFLEKHWENLCDDIDSGEITFVMNLPEDYLTCLQRYLTPNPQRARELREIFSRGFTRPVATLIWPKLKCLVAFGVGSFSVYTAALKKYIGDLRHDNGYLASSAAIIGRAVNGSDAFELMTELYFYEFRTLKEGADDRPCFISELQVGESYEIILTNHAGLYRYATGNVIQVEKCGGEKVTFRPMGHLEERLSLADSFVWEQDIYRSIQACAMEADMTLLDYAYFLEETEDASRLKLLLETDGEGKELSGSIDKNLRATSKVYAEARNAGLAPCIVGWLEPESHLLYRDKQRFLNKTAPDQIKPTHFLNTPAKVKFFLGRAQN